MEGGATFLDHMQFPYVYRVLPSDSVLLTAEAYYALHTGCKRASLMYVNTANAQAEVPPLLAAFKDKAGITVVDIGEPVVLSGALIGAMLPFLFAALTMLSVQKVSRSYCVGRQLIVLRRLSTSLATLSLFSSLGCWSDHH
jgi:hypothetical protein